MDAGLIEGAGDLELEGIAGLEARDDQFFGGAGIGGAFEHNELALMDVGSDGGDGSGDVAEVGLMIAVERSRHADDDGIHFGDIGVVGSGAEAGLLRRLDLLGQDAHDVGSAAVEGGYFGFLDIEAGDAEAFAAEEQGKRQADIAHADDSDAGLASLHPALERLDRGWGGIG